MKLNFTPEQLKEMELSTALAAIWDFELFKKQQVKVALSHPILLAEVERLNKEAVTKAFEEWRVATIKAEQIIKKEAREQELERIVDLLLSKDAKEFDVVHYGSKQEILESLKEK